jgi:hypothetical protein
MSAKHSKKGAKKDMPRTASSVPAAIPNTPAASTASAAAATAGAPDAGTAWIDSTDPRKRTIGKIVLVGVWIYVAALWLLALDQTFHWGIFGPKVPPIP